ncbi:MAG: NUDIX domain-containing protein, partial [Chloroflexi bacterium]|nr:NUDIX domain-containing protein [Chloroflexota bacterium]
MTTSQEYHVAAAILQRADGTVLLLQRSSERPTDPDKWCFVTGYVESGEAPREAAIRELAEEVGIEGLEPARSGELVTVSRGEETLYIHPFLFRVPDDPQLQIDREHQRYI